MKKTALFALLVLAAFSLASQDLVAILTGDTLDPTIGESVVADLRNMKAQLTDAAMNAGMRFRHVEISGSALTKAAIADQVRNIAFGPNDTVFFYYSGHGYRTESKAQRWPNYGFREGRETLDSVWVNDTLKKRGPRLLIVMSDCCNVTFEDIYAPSDPSKRSGGDIKEGYKELFLRTKGMIVVTSSIPGQPSQGYENGGAFSLQFLESLKNGVKEKDPSWSKVLLKATRKIDFGGGLFQDPLFDQFDERGTLIANERGILTSTPAIASVPPEPAKPEPAKPEPAKPEPAKPEPAKPEPTKLEPVGTLAVSGTETDASKGAWTLMFYVMADCDLEGAMLKNAMEAAKAISGTKLNAVFFIDRSDAWSNAPLGSVPDWIGAKYLVAKNGDFSVLETKGRINSGDPAILSAFVSQAMRQFPAERYGLFFANHGFGWNGYGGDESYKSDMLTVREIGTGVGNALRSVKVDKLDVIGFDACLMGAYEVARGVAPVASWLVASEEYVPGHGFEYAALPAFADASRSTAKLLVDFVAAFKKKAEARGTANQATLSAVDLTRMEDLARALKAVQDALRSKPADVSAQAAKLRTDLAEFGKGPSDEESLLAVDLGAFLGAAAARWPHVKQPAEKAMTALRESVLANYTGPARKTATGLSVYYPTSRSLFDAAYDGAVSVPEWRGALDALLASPPGTGPMLAQSQGKAIYAFDSATKRPFVGANLVPKRSDDVVSSWLEYGISVGEGFIMLGRQKAKFTKDRVGSFFDGKAAGVTQGSSFSYAYSIVERTDSAVETTVPFRLYRKGSAPINVRMVAVTDLKTGRTETSFWASNASGAIAQIEPDGTSSLKVLALAQKKGQTRGDRAWFELKDEFLFSDSLFVSFLPIADAERLRLEISVKDAAGNEDWAGWTEP